MTREFCHVFTLTVWNVWRSTVKKNNPQVAWYVPSAGDNLAFQTVALLFVKEFLHGETEADKRTFGSSNFL
jgi:hypothetical protein